MVLSQLKCKYMLACIPLYPTVTPSVPPCIPLYRVGIYMKYTALRILSGHQSSLPRFILKGVVSHTTIALKCA